MADQLVATHAQVAVHFCHPAGAAGKKSEISHQRGAALRMESVRRFNQRGRQKARRIEDAKSCRSRFSPR